MIQQLIAGGRTDTELAVLDVARQLDIPHFDFGACERNTAEADGTLIFSDGDLPEDFAGLHDLAESAGRAYIHVRLKAIPAFQAARDIGGWITAHGIEALHATGPDMGTGVHEMVTDILRTALQLVLMDTAMPGALTLFGGGRKDLQAFVAMPGTVEEAAEALVGKLTFRERTKVANMTEAQLSELSGFLARYIMTEFRLWSGNESLMASCREALEREPGPDDPAWAIIRSLWRKLKVSDRVLRIIK